MDVGDLKLLLDDSGDIVSVLESMKRITDFKLDLVNTRIGNPTGEDQRLKEHSGCEYLRSADTLEKFSSPMRWTLPVTCSSSAPAASSARWNLTATASFQGRVRMKLVLDGIAGAGKSIEMGGFDYHRRQAHRRGADFRAGQCIGACLDYAPSHRDATDDLCFQRRIGVQRRRHRDGQRRGKGVWSGDNSSTAASFSWSTTRRAHPH